MKKLRVNWKIVFGATFLLLLVLFYSFQLHERLRQPIKGWSREVVLNETPDAKISSNTKVRLTCTPIASENRFLVFWNENNIMKFASINNQGIKERIGEADLKLNEPIDIKSQLIKQKIEIYVLEKKRLSVYDFDYRKNMFTSPREISNAVNSYVLYNGKVFTAEDNGIYMVDENETKSLISKKGGEVLDAVLDSEGSYRVAFIKTDRAGSMHVEYALYNPKDGSSSDQEVVNLMTSTTDPQSVDSLVIGYINDSIHILVPLKNIKVNVTKVMDFSFKQSNIKGMKQTELVDLGGYSPNPVRISQDEAGFKLLASILLIKGNKTETYNIKEFTFNKNGLMPGNFYSDAENISTDPFNFTLGNDRYIEWRNIAPTSTKIMFASTNSNIISNAGKLTKEIALYTLFDVLMALGFGLSYMLIVFTCIMLPTLLISIICSICFMSWVEANPRKATNIAVVIHIIADVLLAMFTVMKRPDILKLMPGLLQNPVGLIGLILLLGIICYYLVLLKYNNDDNKLDKSFMYQYAFFAVTNMILYALLFFPYYYL